ncbi:hypothetical protein JOD97_005803 [Duganella sp. 1411]|jgi:hypothetical protein|uniref:hypothetical protein n=1 Tax=Duganella sp. 1411 TaxID=2806572 RepID=UPI001AE127F6|nr:hypothetical protein [Duganella sp. 1411]MBP1207720.1 hypothetical protein [Duganella sp. 1411]
MAELLCFYEWRQSSGLFAHDPFPDFATGSEKVLKEQGSIEWFYPDYQCLKNKRVVLLVVQKMQENV